MLENQGPRKVVIELPRPPKSQIFFDSQKFFWDMLAAWISQDSSITAELFGMLDCSNFSGSTQISIFPHTLGNNEFKVQTEEVQLCHFTKSGAV